jgi:hypothetical protein
VVNQKEGTSWWRPEVKPLLVPERNWDACSGNLQWQKDGHPACPDGGDLERVLS